MGSIAENEAGRHYMYRSSKAGLNAAVKSLSFDLKPRGITCVVVHPGWVQTDMGGPEATIDAGTSVSGLRRVIDRLGPRDTGRFFGYEDRKSVVEGKSVSVRVDLGGCRILKKKIINKTKHTAYTINKK